GSRGDRPLPRQGLSHRRRALPARRRPDTTDAARPLFRLRAVGRDGWTAVVAVHDRLQPAGVEVHPRRRDDGLAAPGARARSTAPPRLGPGDARRRLRRLSAQQAVLPLSAVVYRDDRPGALLPAWPERHARAVVAGVVVLDGGVPVQSLGQEGILVLAAA